MPFIFTWVLKNKLALGSVPEKKENVEKLRLEGIKSIFTLCSSSEAEISDSIDSDFLVKKLILPDHKSERKMDIGELNSSIKILSSLVHHGPTFVHCFASIERSPLICIAWLVYKEGLDMEMALNYLMKIHPLSCPLSDQLKLINESLSK